MKILLVSTSEKTGGAAIACTRLFHALSKSGADVEMLVRDIESADPALHSVNTGWLSKVINFAGFCLERLRILVHLGFCRKNLFQVSLDNIGAFRLLANRHIREADIIHFHWTSQGMLSQGQLQKLLLMGKKVIFTMHDMHSFTGICHYARNCTGFTAQCGNCQYVAGGRRANDISRRWLKKKISMPNRTKMKFVACSRWLAGIARTSSYMKGVDVLDIPNPIDTSVFAPADRTAARQRFGVGDRLVILFGAVNVADPRKGFTFLEKALQYVYEQYPDRRGDIELLVFGKCGGDMLMNLPFHHTLAGYLGSGEDLVAAYSAADVYVTPSLEDNLPNTVMEALACATPCVSFDVGGLSQLIDHEKNGYVAKYMDYEDLGRGIMHVLSSPNYSIICSNARRKVEECFSEPVVAARYLEAYNSL